jgi:AcrR family transcriptional regulator
MAEQRYDLRKRYDLRERKRTRTRLMIQAEAMRLFAEQGYENTRVDEIAYAAAISPRTFYRYFPTKEDVVMWDEYDPTTLDFLERRPANEPFAETMRAFIREAVGGLYRRDPEELLLRARLLLTVPELRARMMEEQRTAGQMLASWLAERQGPAADEIELRVVATALGAAVMVAMDVWQTEDGKPDLLALVDRATAALAGSTREGRCDDDESRPLTSDDGSGASNA